MFSILFLFLGALGQECLNRSFGFNTILSDSNPLRGFMPYQGSAGTKFPCSMEYNYVAMKDVMTGENTYNWQKLENLLNDVKSRSRQTVFRLYLDYPDCCPDGQYNTGVPAFLLNGTNPVTLTPYSDYGGGKSPSYNNERLVSAIERLVAQMGKKYNGDNRIGFIQVGLLGFWGEWHTYPRTNFMANRATQLRVIKAYHNAFNITKLVISADELDYWEITDTLESRTSSYRLGWHDDNFGEGTYSDTNSQDWFFYPRLQSHSLLNAFKYKAFGGEIQPTIQAKIFRNNWTGQNFTKCVEKTKVSWLLNQFAFQTDTDLARVNNTRSAARLLGYQFHIARIRVSRIPNGYNATVTVINKGNAPFYYPLSLIVSVVSNNTVIQQVTATRSLNLLQPSAYPSHYSVSLSKNNIPLDAFLRVYLYSKFVYRWIIFATNGAKGNGFDVPLRSCLVSA